MKHVSVSHISVDVLLVNYFSVSTCMTVHRPEEGGCLFLSGDGVAETNEATQRRARLVVRWVTAAHIVKPILAVFIGTISTPPSDSRGQKHSSAKS